MKFRIFSIVWILFLSCASLYAQNDENDLNYKTTIIAGNTDVVFDNTIDYLQDNGHFLQSLDKQAGFIQARLFIKDNRVFSAKSGERRTLNFVIRQAEENKSKVTLNIYIDNKHFGGDNSNRTYYYEEQGISEDKTLYRDVFDQLIKSF